MTRSLQSHESFVTTHPTRHGTATGADTIRAVTQHPLSLLPHAASPALLGVSLEADAQRMTHGLRLRYTLRAPQHLLQLPAPASPGFADQLWQHTCLEAFVAMPDSPHYREFNFSPSGQFAEYHFSDERVRAEASPSPATPQLQWSITDHGLELVAEVALGGIASTQELLIGLTAVLEDHQGQVGHWSLHHAKDRPDFHDRRGWTLRLPPFSTSHPC